MSAPSSILVGDDSNVQRAFAIDLCRQLGIAEIQEASSGELAFNILRTPEPRAEVLLVDLEMPGMDGVALLEALHEADIVIPVVIASGRDRQLIEAVGRMISALGIPVLGTLSKPLNKESLSKAFGSVLD